MGLIRPADLASVIPAVNGICDQIENIEPWHYPADAGLYLNGWADGGAGILRVRYRRTFDGLVFMEGQPTRVNSVQNELIFGPLPVGYFPQNSIHFVVPDPYGPITELSVDSTGVRYQSAGKLNNAPHIVLCYTAYKPR